MKLVLSVFLILYLPLCSQVTEQVRELKIDDGRSTIKTRFTPPRGYEWEPIQDGSFAEFLANFPLHPEGFPVQDFTGAPIKVQDKHAAVLKIDVGERDLQQCADAWMRLYAEYLWLKNRKTDIAFDFTSGQRLSWEEFKNGRRTIEDGDRVKFFQSGKKDASYANFRSYLDLIFQYAGTISLDRESVPVTDNQDIRIGDYLITPGSPGHSVFIVGIAKNRWGKRLYLLAEGYMPAQSIHILKNPLNRKISPWYELDVNAKRTFTAKYIFGPNIIKRYVGLNDLQEQIP